MRLVTIILTTLNSERYLSRSIESCLGQTYQDLELLVVDGGSYDRTLDIVHSYDDPRIRLTRQPDNQGRLPGALNLGMAKARGEYLTWTQDDCWYEPYAIGTMVQHLEAHPEVALVYTDYWEVDADGHRVRYREVHPPEDILCDDVIRVSFLFRRSVYQAVGPQNASYFPVHEIPWRLKVVRHFKVQPLHVPLMHYTVHLDSLTGRFGGWRLERMTADALLHEGAIDKRTHRRRLARIDADEGYEAWLLKGEFRLFRRLLLRAAARDPSWLQNAGLWRVWFLSLLPCRNAYRARRLAAWEEAKRAADLDLIQKYGPPPGKVPSCQE